jgi:renalase
MTLSESAVVVVGAGISGIACARELQAAGHEVVVLDRSKRIGGRMARWTRDGRAVDIGAAYFTVRDPEFGRLAEDWARRGLARPWTDTFTVADSDGVGGPAPGPVRWATEHGLRSLVEDLASGLDVRRDVEVDRVGAGPTVDGRPVRAVVLAMPDPQARDLLGEDLAGLRGVLSPQWEPVITVVASYPQRTWVGLDGMFVHESPVSLVVDDGRRRGDNAPVLVVHSAHEAAAEYLDDPARFVPTALAEISRLVGATEPVWAEAKRWGSATPTESRSHTFLLDEQMVGLCGDGWSDRPRVEAAWLSGRDLGRALVPALDNRLVR